MQTLKLYCDVARHRSISLAAAEHGITQSAVSQRISQLEKRLGVALLDRSVRPLKLTSAGQAYLSGCQDLLERCDRLEQDVSRMRQVAGHLRVDAIYSAGIDLLNHVRQRFVAEHPDVTVTVNYQRPEQVHAEVREGRCDLGIISYPSRWRSVVAIPLRNERMVVVCQPDHPLCHQRAVQAEQLAHWPMVAFESQLPVGQHIRKYLRSHGVTPDVDNVFDNIDTIKNAVTVTDRVAILPRRSVLREVEAMALAVVPLEPALERPLGIIRNRRGVNGHGFSSTAQPFVDFLIEHAGPGADQVVPASPQGQLVGGDR